MKTLVIGFAVILAALDAHADPICQMIRYGGLCASPAGGASNITAYVDVPAGGVYLPTMEANYPAAPKRPAGSCTLASVSSAQCQSSSTFATPEQVAKAIQAALKEERDIAYKQQAKLMAELIAQMAASNTNVENTQKLMMRLLDCRGLTANALTKCEAKYPLAVSPAPVAPGPPAPTN